MANLSGFDANTVENVMFEPVPASKYVAVITSSELKAQQGRDRGSI